LPKSSQEPVQLRGTFTEKHIEGSGHKKRLVGSFEDHSGEIDVLWFQRYKDIDHWIKTGKPYLIYGKLQNFRGQFSIVHPEIEEISEDRITATGTGACL
jgi:ATP-dependent DNA helicase RecG